MNNDHQYYRHQCKLQKRNTNDQQTPNTMAGFALVHSCTMTFEQTYQTNLHAHGTRQNEHNGQQINRQ